jgi:hypothetical protein
MRRQLDTGTGATRRRLTEEEAKRGDAPTAFTKEEWEAMHRAARCEPGPAQWSLGVSQALRGLFNVRVEAFSR